MCRGDHCRTFTLGSRALGLPSSVVEGTYLSDCFSPERLVGEGKEKHQSSRGYQTSGNKPDSFRTKNQVPTLCPLLHIFKVTPALRVG
jgi:hypothetical protein